MDTGNSAKDYRYYPPTKTVAERFMSAHVDANHFYDGDIPHGLHLKIAVQVFKKFIHLVPEEYHTKVEDALWGHDSVEDARLTYNDVLKITNKFSAEIIRAVTNYGRGRDRDERMPDFVYDDIRNTPWATFVKLCDRIANITYSKIMGSDKFEMYKKEQAHFEDKLRVGDELKEMWEYIHFLFESNPLFIIETKA